MVRIGALGDVLLTRRLTCSLHHAGFRSTLMAPARHATVLLGDPWIERILDSESPALATTFTGTWPESFGHFDAALVISDSPSLVDAAAAAAPVVIRIPPAPGPADSLISRQWAEAARAVCDPFPGEMPPLTTRAEDATFSRATLIHAGSGSPRKNWPIDRFLELSRKLAKRGQRVVWIRGPAEMTLPDGWEGERLDRPSLSNLAATLAASPLFIGNDSGVSHLAGAVGAATVSLFGPTQAAIWRPDGPRVQVVDSADGTMSGISVEAVMDAVNRVH